MILLVDLRGASAPLDAIHPAFTARLTRPPPEGCIRVVAIAAGGAMLVHSEIALVSSPCEYRRLEHRFTREYQGETKPRPLAQAFSGPRPPTSADEAQASLPWGYRLAAFYWS
jgi:hypothetical protein